MQSPQFSLLLKARLLELALDADGKTAIEALKLLHGGAADAVERLDPVLMALPIEALEEALKRATEYVVNVAGGVSAGGDSGGDAGAGGALLTSLRQTDYAKLSDGAASQDDHERSDAAGIWDDQEVDY